MSRFHNPQNQYHMGMYSSSSSSSRLMEHKHLGLIMEKRQLFLRSYQFSRKQSFTERIKRSVIRAKRMVWSRLSSARRLRRVVWSRLRFAFSYRSRRFVRLLNTSNLASGPSYRF